MLSDFIEVLKAKYEIFMMKHFEWYNEKPDTTFMDKVRRKRKYKANKKKVKKLIKQRKKWRNKIENNS